MFVFHKVPKRNKQLHIYIIIFHERFFVLNSSGERQRKIWHFVLVLVCSFGRQPRNYSCSSYIYITHGVLDGEDEEEEIFRSIRSKKINLLIVCVSVVV